MNGSRVRFARSSARHLSYGQRSYRAPDWQTVALVGSLAASSRSWCGSVRDLVNGELVVTDLVPTEMSPIVTTTEIDRPADEVFAYATDALRRMAEVRHRRRDGRTGHQDRYPLPHNPGCR